MGAMTWLLKKPIWLRRIGEWIYLKTARWNPWIEYRRQMWAWERRHTITYIKGGVPTKRPRLF